MVGWKNAKKNILKGQTQSKSFFIETINDKTKTAPDIAVRLLKKVIFPDDCETDFSANKNFNILKINDAKAR